MKQYNIYLESIFSDNKRQTVLLTEGLVGDIINMFKGVASKVKAKLDQLKDSAEMMAIKALNSIDKVKQYIKAHPQLIWLIFAAMIAGYLVLPREAHAAIATPDQIKDLATSMPIDLVGTVKDPSISINATTPEFASFFKKMLDISLEGNTSTPNILQDIINNYGTALEEFLLKNDLFMKIHDANPEKAKEIYDFAFKKIAKILMDKTIGLK